MARLLHLDGGAPHPAAEDLLHQARTGQISRREFLRTASWLGVSAASASAAVGLSGCGRKDAPQPPANSQLRFVCAIQQIDDPALTTWVEASNLLRNSLEFLTEVDENNITHPYLAESWRPSDDLKTWDFVLRPGVRWSNGDAFGADDAIFNIERWISPKSKSVNRTAFAFIESVEKTGDLSFRLHMKRALCSLPEQLYAFSCPIVHRHFDAMGANWPKHPIGTGPFEMTDYQVGRSATFRRRDGYWGPPPPLQQLDYIDLGPDTPTHVAALAAGQADILYRITIAELELVNRLQNVKILRTPSAQTIVMRMQVDQAPFNDVRIRRAITLCANNQQMLDVAYRGHGAVGENHHVAPTHPDYYRLPKQKRDPGAARQLLAQAGYPNGLDIALTLGDTQGKWEQDTAQVLQQNCAEAGIRINLNIVPAAAYWSMWNKVPFGLTYWAHRPLGVMALDLAYRTGSVWNESHFSDPAFDAALDQAMAILDPKQRSLALGRAEKILQDQAVILQAYWPDKFTAASDKVRNYRVHPSDYFRMDKVWLA